MKKFMHGKWTEWSDSLQNERKSLPAIPLIRDSYQQYIKIKQTNRNTDKTKNPICKWASKNNMKNMINILVIRVMQIKTMVRRYHTTVKMATI